MCVWSFDDLSIWILCYKKIDLRRTVCRRRRQIGQKWPFVHWASNWRWRKQIWKNLTTISAPQATLPDARHLQELHLSFLFSSWRFLFSLDFWSIRLKFLFHIEIFRHTGLFKNWPCLFYHQQNFHQWHQQQNEQLCRIVAVIWSTWW